MKKLLIGAVALSVLATSTAFAQEKTAPMNTHANTYYAEANIGTNLYYAPGASALTSGVQGYGYNVNGGYFYTATSAIEAGIMQNFAKYKDEGVQYNGHVTAPYAAFRFNTPIGDHFSLITKLGVMYAKVSGSNGALILPYTGIGGSYAVTKNIDINMQYQGAVYVVTGAGLLSGGVTYHFD